MATLISISTSPDGGGRFIGVDNTGVRCGVGEVKRDRSSGGEYLDWKPIRSEFERR
jgi:hypothetical protein